MQKGSDPLRLLLPLGVESAGASAASVVSLRGVPCYLVWLLLIGYLAPAGAVVLVTVKWCCGNSTRLVPPHQSARLGGGQHVQVFV